VHNFGFEMMAAMGTQCLVGVATNFELEEMNLLDSDSYDPSKPEYIVPATQEEVEQANAVLLAQQIAKLGAHAARRRTGSKVVSHYQRVLSTLRSKEECTRSKLTSQLAQRRVRSEPSLLHLDEEVETSAMCGAVSEWLVAVPEESPAEFDDDEFLWTLDEGGHPAVQSVRSCPTWMRHSMTQLNSESRFSAQQFIGATPLDSEQLGFGFL